MNLRACILTVTLSTLFLLSPCLAGEFGQTRQYFAQYGLTYYREPLGQFRELRSMFISCTECQAIRIPFFGK